MTKYYNVVLINRNRSRKVSYLADSFSVNDDGILKIYSKEYDDVVVQIGKDEELSVTTIVVRHWYDDELED